MLGKREILAFALGCATLAAFAPFGLFPVSIAALAILFALWRDSPPWQSARIGFAFGFGLFIVGVHWIYISVRAFGGAPVAVAVAAVCVIAMIQALFFAIIGYIQSIAKVSQTVRFLALLPALWVLAEWVRSWLFSGFPWLYIGYTQTDSWLNGFAPIAGVLGMSLAVCATASALALMRLGKQSWRQNALLLSLVALIWIAGAVGGRIDWVTAAPNQLDIALVQADVSIEDKFDRASAKRTLQHFLQASDDAREADLIVWPETALAYSVEQLRETDFFYHLQTHPSDFLFGVLEFRQGDASDSVYNSVYGVSEEIGVYRKRHLVPFGEYVPLRNWVSKLDEWVYLPDDMTAFTDVQRPIEVANTKVGVSICYEIAFPAEVLRMLPEASVLVNVSEDAWFGRMVAPFQQLQMSRVRAMESGRPVLRAANQGVSAAIDHKGSIIAMLKQADGTTLHAKVKPAYGSTPFVKGGQIGIVMSAFGLIGLCVFIRVAKKARSRPPS